MADETIRKIKESNPGSSVDVTNLTDDDIRQLIIYYATLIRDPNNSLANKVCYIWESWDPALWTRFSNMVHSRDNKDCFWARPADNNIRYTNI